MMAKHPSAFEQGKPSLPADIRIECWMAGALIGNIKRLAGLAENTPDALDQGCLVLSAFFNAGAALEAILHEYAYKTNFLLYEGVDPSLKKSQENFRRKGIKEKYELLRQFPSEPGNPPTLLASDFPDVVMVLDARHALAHNEPDSTRSHFVGEINNVKGAYWAFLTVLDFAKSLWGDSLPQEYGDDAGVSAG
jgi:hypothetical protein